MTGNRLSKLYYISDVEISHVRELIRRIREGNQFNGIVLRDIPEQGLHVKTLLKYVFRDDYMIRLYEQNRIMELSEDAMDYSYRIQMQYGDVPGFRLLSTQYLAILVRLVMEITGCEKKVAVKAVKYAKEGKKIEKYNILEQCIREKRNER